MNEREDQIVEIEDMVRNTWKYSPEGIAFGLKFMIAIYHEDQAKFKAIRDNMARLEELQMKVEQPAN